MSFTKNQHLTQSPKPAEKGLFSTIANFFPIFTLTFEQLTGQSIPQAKGTLADILSALQRLESKIDSLEKNCAEQFIQQEQQLTSLQKISKLVSTEKTKSVHFANDNKFPPELDQ
jgi:DNA-binding transcriptional regulator GbsR (MarR family)